MKIFPIFASLIVGIPNMAGENRLLHMMLKNIINIIKHYYYGLRNW